VKESGHAGGVSAANHSTPPAPTSISDSRPCSFLFAGGWGHVRPNTIHRSVTPTPTTPRKSPLPLPHRLAKSTSSPQINKARDTAMAAVAPPHQPVGAMRDEVLDTRTPSPVQRANAADGAPDAYMPDLSAEVAMLSTKLVNAINYQTNLDDSLQQTRHELDHANSELTRLRQHQKEMDDMIASGVLVRKAQVDRTLAQMREELEQERAAREAAEKAKKQTDGELENLTSALFEEANTMVASARKEVEAVEKRNSQLRNQLNDTEVLLTSQTEQLQDLKTVMERMDRMSEHEAAARESSIPSTPINSTTNAWETVQSSPNAAVPIEVPPNHPLHFSQLILPVIRNDTVAYQEFQDLISLGRRASPHSRQGSNGINHLTSASQQNLASSSPLPGAFSFSVSTSANSSPSSANFSNASAAIPPLKESKFYKRALLEDIEPTLRLDLAPGLSFLSRRAVFSSLLSGTLAVEPFVPHTKFYSPVYACALCGEQRKHAPYIRTHRFRTSEDASAQRYPLCDYCLGRVRASCDFMGFLRMLRDGHWRAESEEEQKGAWEEAGRLRERMFWARLGGGVVPAMQLMRRDVNGSSDDSPESVRAAKNSRSSRESVLEQVKESVAANGDHAANGLGRASEDEPQASPLPGQGSPERRASGIDETVLETTSSELSSDGPNVLPDRPAERSTVAQTGGESTSDEEAQHSEKDKCEVVSDEARATAAENPISSSNVPSALKPGDEPQPNKTGSSTTDNQAVSTPEPQMMQECKQKPRELATPPPLTERRPSSVLARVRAMEAKVAETKKLPGAFD